MGFSEEYERHFQDILWVHTTHHPTPLAHAGQLSIGMEAEYCKLCDYSVSSYTFLASASISCMAASLHAARPV